MFSNLADRFWPKVDTSGGPTACWTWTGDKFKAGYGRFYVSRKDGQKYAHRLSWEMANGPIPDGLIVCHTCDVRACVNPQHMWLGTIRDNITDMWRKGRGTVRRGSKSRAAKLTEGDIAFIRANASRGPRGRKRPEPGKLATSDLARRFGVSPCTISSVVCGRYWRHVA